MNLEGYEWLRKSLESEAGQQKIEKVKALSHLAREVGVPMARFALAWCLKNPDVSTVITGASHQDQVTENMKALNDVQLLDNAVMERVEEILQNKPEIMPRFR